MRSRDTGRRVTVRSSGVTDKMLTLDVTIRPAEHVAVGEWRIHVTGNEVDWYSASIWYHPPNGARRDHVRSPGKTFGTVWEAEQACEPLIEQDRKRRTTQVKSTKVIK